MCVGSCSVPVVVKPVWTVITAAAFADSINPCAIAVLVILLAELLTIHDRRSILFSSLSFISALYITYFALGIGLLGVISLAGIAQACHKIIGVLAIVVGLLNIKDFFWYGGGGFVMEIPRAWRPTIQKLLKSVTNPWAAFVIGVLVTFFELPCTGGPYAFVRGLLSQGVAWPRVIIILLYYNVIFVLPLILLTSLVYFGLTTTERINAWKDRNLRLLHLIAGFILLALGVWVFAH